MIGTNKSPTGARPTIRSFVAGLAAAACAVVALTIGLAFLHHPISGWSYGIPQRSEAAPVLGVGFIVVPVVVVGLGLRRIWYAGVVAIEVRRQQHRRPS